jgi:uncharacterized iron-regulated protein
MKKEKSEKKLRERYEKLASKIAEAGPILQGSISERVIRGEKDQKQKPGKIYGPYYQWTFKQEGKTVTVNLSREQAKAYRKAIRNNKKLNETLKEMRALSRKILDAETAGVTKRKS